MFKTFNMLHTPQTTPSGRHFHVVLRHDIQDAIRSPPRCQKREVPVMSKKNIVLMTSHMYTSRVRQYSDVVRTWYKCRSYVMSLEI